MTPSCALQGPDCDGRVQLHHVVPRQRLRRAWKAAKAEERRTGVKAWSITAAIKDERNLIGLCVFHHMQVEAKRLRCPVSVGAWAFAEEYGLDAMLAEDLRRAA